MDRVYGRNQQCDVCGRSPPIGFLYECRQDWVPQSLRDLLTKDDEKDDVAVVKSDMRLELEWLGLSESVILTAEQGHYTRAQLEKIKTQKKELRQIISDSLQATQINDAAATLAVLAQAPSNHDGAENSTPGKEAVSHISTLSPGLSNTERPEGTAKNPTDISPDSSMCRPGLSYLSSILPRPRTHLLPVCPSG